MKDTSMQWETDRVQADLQISTQATQAKALLLELSVLRNHLEKLLISS